MKKLFTVKIALFLLTISAIPLQAQETINVTFRFETTESAQRAFVPGEFNNWGNNNSGRIDNNDGSLMTEDAENGFWYQTISLTVGGGGATHNGKSGYAYKFHEQYNASGSEWNWFTDPLNDIAIGPNSDSFIEVTYPLIFQMGRENGIAGSDLEVWVTVASTDTDSIDVIASQVYINDVLVGNFENNYDKERQLFYEKDISGYNLITGFNEFKIKAVTESGATTVDSLNFTFVGSPSDVDQPRPAGLKDGITYGENGTSATLSLFAPNKSDVFVIGDLTNWTVDLDYKMYRDSLNADSMWFWLELEGLTAGQQYGFQYLIDGDITIAEPYAQLVLDQSNDSFIPASTFPNLKPYPIGQTSGLVSVLQPGKPDFEWTDDEYVRPNKENLVIYELLMRDFFETPSYTALIDTLDYLQGLGINVIELMPVNEFNGNLSWGYNPTSHYALDKFYGSPDSFKAFVNEAHNRGIAVIVDVVLNHADNPHSLNKLYNLSSNPYFNIEPKHSYNVFTDFNHQYSGTQQYVKQVVQHWIEEYKIDGFRWDLTKGFTQNCTFFDEGCTNRYQQDRVDILKKYADYQWEVDPDFIIIFEHLGTDQEETEWADYRVDEGKGIMFWGKMNPAYNEASMGYHDGGKSNLSGVLSQSRGFQKRHLVGYMESHDEQWLMFKNRSFGNSSGDYNVKDLGTALDRQELAGVFFFTLPGPKMMWQFGELGYGYGDNGEECLKPGDDSNGDCAASVAGRTGAKPIRWDYNEDEDRKDLYNVWSQLIRLRFSSDAFSNPETSSYALSGPIKHFRYTHSDTDVVAIGNFSVTSTTENVEFTKDGTWYDFFNNSEVEVVGTQQELTLAAGEYRLFTTKKFDIVPVSSELEDYSAPLSFSLHQNYPNPFNPSTNINYDIAENGLVTLDIYNLLGQKVATLVNEAKTVGSYTARFDATGLSSGVYIARLHSGNVVQTQKMMLLK